MEAPKKSYPTDLTDDQWELGKDLIPAAGTGGVDVAVGGLSGVTYDAAKNQYYAISDDPKGIALTNNGTVFVSSEGEANIGAGRVSDPFIKEFSLTTGQEVRSPLNE